MDKLIDNLKKSGIMALLLGATTFILFVPALRCGFVNYDDDLYVYRNIHVAGGLSWSGLAYGFTTTDGGSWMPLTWVSYFVDATFFGTPAAGYHLTNICLHAASVAIL